MSNRDNSRRRFLGMAGTIAFGTIAGCARQTDTGDRQSTTTSTTARTNTETPTATETTGATSTTAKSRDATFSDLTGPRHGDDLPADDTPFDGYPPKFRSIPQQRSVDTSTFSTIK